EYGHLIGIVGAGLPGDSRSVDDIVEARGSLNGAPVIPFSYAAVAPGKAQSLAALRTDGHVMQAIGDTLQGESAGWTRAAPGKRSDAIPEYVKEFSLADPSIGVVVSWAPTEKVRGNAVVRVHDLENRVVATSQPKKVGFSKGDRARSSWDMPMLTQPGVY